MFLKGDKMVPIVLLSHCLCLPFAVLKVGGLTWLKCVFQSLLAKAFDLEAADAHQRLKLPATGRFRKTDIERIVPDEQSGFGHSTDNFMDTSISCIRLFRIKEPGISTAAQAIEIIDLKTQARTSYGRWAPNLEPELQRLEHGVKAARPRGKDFNTKYFGCISALGRLINRMIGLSLGEILGNYLMCRAILDDFPACQVNAAGGQ